MLLKIKTYLTVFTLYEIIAVIMLHCPRICDSMFGVAFCDDHVFKYFIACFAVPALAFLIAMWISEIVHSVRRRRSFTYRAKHAVMGVVDNVRNSVSKHVSGKDLEKLMTVALVMGLKKYAQKHPHTRDKIAEMLNTDLSDITLEFDGEYEMDDEDDDEEGEDVVMSKPASRGARRVGSDTNTKRRGSTKSQNRRK